MAKRLPTFRKVDVTRFIEAVKAGGIAIGRVEFEDGKIAVVSASDAAAGTSSPLDEWLKSNAH
jgi:hypothetical protein